jgi:hypothetical protein
MDIVWNYLKILEYWDLERYVVENNNWISINPIIYIE